MQVFAADVVIDAYDAALHKGMAAFGSICVNFAPSVFLGGVADMQVTAKEVFADASVGSSSEREPTYS
jgi:hypothetical protein